MRKMGLGVALMVLVLGLGACGSQVTKPASSSSVQSSKSSTVQTKPKVDKADQGSQAKVVASHADAKSAAAKQALWSSDKSARLAQFMQDWGAEMKQTYQSYWTGHSVSFYGLLAPDDFDTMIPAMNDAPLDYGLATDGTSSHQYAVVAIYSDADTARFGVKHLYLFTIHDGQPTVLVTMQNQGNENSWLYFNPSQNADLQNGFAAIVND